MLTALLAVPVGVAAAIYLEEYGGREPGRADHRDQHRQPRRRAVDHLRPARARAVRPHDGHGTERAGRRLDAGAAGAAGRHPLDARGAARGARDRLREGSYALGATKWQTIWYQVLPVALPGILTGLILALSRAIGETAPLITIGALTYVPFAPDSDLVAVHRAADPDLQLGVAAAGRVPRQRRRRHPRAAGAAPVDERRRDLAARSLPEARLVMSTASSVRSPRSASWPRRDRRQQPAAIAPCKIDVERLNFYYGEKRALQDISIRIKPNVVTAFIGPSGCGKSTFLRTLNRMNDIIPGTRVEGTVLIDGADIYESGHRRGAAAAPGRHGVPEVEPVPEVDLRERRLRPAHQRHGRKPSRSWRSASRRACKQAALWDEVKDRLHESALALSGGQQQRLCIARALAVRPEILLMDEPASALDPIATQRIEELIYELKKTYTIVIVTHNMQQAARVSDYTAFFWLGRLVEYDRTDKIFTAPAEKLTEDYVTGRFG